MTLALFNLKSAKDNKFWNKLLQDEKQVQSELPKLYSDLFWYEHFHKRVLWGQFVPFTFYLGLFTVYTVGFNAINYIGDGYFTRWKTTLLLTMPAFTL